MNSYYSTSFAQQQAALQHSQFGGFQHQTLLPPAHYHSYQQPTAKAFDADDRLVVNGHDAALMATDRLATDGYGRVMSHQHLAAHQQQQRWSMSSGGDSTDSPPPAPLQTQFGAPQQVQLTQPDCSPPSQSPSSAGYSSAQQQTSPLSHVPFYPWMGVVGKSFLSFYPCCCSGNRCCHGTQN